eukprot:gene4984-5642_t
MDTINRVGIEYGMAINVKKTKTMVISRKEVVPKVTIHVKVDKLEQVQKFVYLGHMITEDGKCETEIKRRIEIARSAFNQMKALLVSGKISVKVRIRFARCYIWSTLMYGAEAWTINNVMQTKLEAFEMWIYRRIMKVPWTAKKSNVEVLTLVNERRKLMGMIKKRKLKYFGHILRHPCLGKELCEVMVNGKRGGGRPRLKWSDNITKWTDKSYAECSRIASDRNRWRSMVANLLPET